jgi:hypothetical protein
MQRCARGLSDRTVIAASGARDDPLEDVYHVGDGVIDRVRSIR